MQKWFTSFDSLIFGKELLEIAKRKLERHKWINIHKLHFITNMGGIYIYIYIYIYILRIYIYILRIYIYYVYVYMYITYYVIEYTYLPAILLISFSNEKQRVVD